MVILLFGKSIPLSENKYIGKQNFFSHIFFSKKCFQHEGNGIFASEYYNFAVCCKFKKECVRAKN
jgi:hypothetical protein